MKRYLLFVVLLLTSFSFCFSQEKVIDKSGKKPKWVDGLVKDFIISAGNGATSQEAQRNALAMVKERIVASVAENVKSSSNLLKEETNYNNRVFNFLEKFSSKVSTQSLNVPFLQGISLSQVREFYWEKLQRKDKSTYYSYYIKYPFPDVELSKLVFEFKLRDEELTQQLNNLLAQADDVESVEQIEKIRGELGVLSDYFADGRKDQAILGVSRCNSMLSSIEIVEGASSLGELKYSLQLGTKIIATVKNPITKSECARINSTNRVGETWVVNYNFENCYEDPENNILVKYRFGNSDVQKKFYFDVALNKTEIFVTDPIHFYAVTKGDSVISSSSFDLVIVSKYSSSFTIEKVVLTLKGASPIVIDGINQAFSGKGNHQLKLGINQEISIGRSTSAGKSVSLLSGYIHYKSDVTGEVKTYRLYNQSYSTDW